MSEKNNESRIYAVGVGTKNHSGIFNSHLNKVVKTNIYKRDDIIIRYKKIYPEFEIVVSEVTLYDDLLISDDANKLLSEDINTSDLLIENKELKKRINAMDSMLDDFRKDLAEHEVSVVMVEDDIVSQCEIYHRDYRNRTKSENKTEEIKIIAEIKKKLINYSYDDAYDIWFGSHAHGVLVGFSVRSNDYTRNRD